MIEMDALSPKYLLLLKKTKEKNPQLNKTNLSLYRFRCGFNIFATCENSLRETDECASDDLKNSFRFKESLVTVMKT